MRTRFNNKVQRLRKTNLQKKRNLISTKKIVYQGLTQNIISNHGALRYVPTDIHSYAGQGSKVPYKIDMEEAFNRDFNDVRVYTNQYARAASQLIGVEAFTVGNNIFSAHTNPTKKTIAHELTHVAQHNHSVNSRSEMIASENDPAEQEARKVQHEIMKGNNAPVPKTKIGPFVIAPNWGAPVCLPLEGYRIEAQYNPESDQLRLIIPNYSPILNFGDPGISALEVEEAIGLHEPDRLQNREWRNTESGWEIRFDVVVYSNEGRQRLDEFFSPQNTMLIGTQEHNTEERQTHISSGRQPESFREAFRIGFQRGLTTTFLNLIPVFAQLNNIMSALGFAPSAIVYSLTASSELSIVVDWIDRGAELAVMIDFDNLSVSYAPFESVDNSVGMMAAGGFGGAVAIRYTPMTRISFEPIIESYAGESYVGHLETLAGSFEGTISPSLLSGLRTGERREGWIALSTSFPGLSLGIGLSGGVRRTVLRFGSLSFGLTTDPLCANISATPTP